MGALRAHIGPPSPGSRKRDPTSPLRGEVTLAASLREIASWKLRRDPISGSNQLGAQARELLVADRSRFLELIELPNLVGDAEANHAP